MGLAPTCYAFAQMTLAVGLVMLATFRLTRFVVDDTFPPMRWLRDRIAFRARKQGHRVADFFDELITCPWCASIWIAAGVTWATDRLLAGGLTAPVLVALAASGITGIIATVLPD